MAARNMGVALDRLGRTEEALSLLEQALRLKPNEPSTTLSLADGGRPAPAASYAALV